MDSNGNYLFKVLVVGCCAAGKTCCIRKAVSNQFTTEYKTTIGVDFAAKTIKLRIKDKDVNVCIQFWDIAGQEYYSQLSRAYYKGAYGCFIVSDLTSDSLCQDIKTWKDEVKSKVMLPSSDEPVPTILLCNKIDLPKAKDVWERDETRQQIDSLQMDEVIATSAVTGQGLDEAMTLMAKKIIAKLEGKPQSGLSPIVIPLDEPEMQVKPKSCC
ncbi:Rab32 [Hexamita inflata]|uniref:Rab32 n=1 Tax=Hexamita inflata TaxID=28002 RepID=A0ABP1GDD5_9EUKA